MKITNNNNSIRIERTDEEMNESLFLTLTIQFAFSIAKYLSNKVDDNLKECRKILRIMLMQIIVDRNYDALEFLKMLKSRHNFDFIIPTEYRRFFDDANISLESETV